MIDLITLAERCEAASRADRAIDHDIALFVGAKASNGVLNIAPRYTASIDAALTLVPVGMGWTAGWGQVLPNEPMGGAIVVRNARFIGYDANYDAVAFGEATTPALALCAAAIRARATEKPA